MDFDSDCLFVCLVKQVSSGIPFKVYQTLLLKIEGSFHHSGDPGNSASLKRHITH